MYINKTIIVLLGSLLAFLANAQQPVVITFAGNGIAARKDGVGTNAEFYAPNGIAIDKSGNVFATDQGSNTIRKITPCGIVTTVAGDGNAGFIDGPGTSAEFMLPVRIAVDDNDNLYVADRDNHCIRKITPSGFVSTLAGTGTPGYKNGPGNIAQFNKPTGVAVDVSGNVYVADQWNYCIRKITPGGIVSLYAGIPDTAGFLDGPALTAKFTNTVSTAVDLNGNVYVSDLLNHCIRNNT